MFTEKGAAITQVTEGIYTNGVLDTATILCASLIVFDYTDGMVPVITDKLGELQALCRRHRVTRLAVFGSAVTGGFSPESSDLDFVVEFAEMDPVEHADSYLSLLVELERLFGRPIDLVEERAIRNPFFRQGVNATRHLLYGP